MKKAKKKELRQLLVCDWLHETYLQFNSLRYDVVSDRLQIKTFPNPPSLGGDGMWRDLTDIDINSMVCQCVNDVQTNISVAEMWIALKSDMVPAVHPLREWLNKLKPYTLNQPDWIDMVASQVKVNPSGEEAKGDKARGEELWRACFKKWFVAMVASWMKDEVINHTALVLVGRQGIYKTTWLEHLMPPELRAYSSKLPLSGQITKDDRLRLCENGLLNIDELDAIFGREMNIVKSLLTSTDVNERAAYGRLKERRMRLASFCASTNRHEFLTDITGNRRWLPFEVESIQNPFYTTLPYQLMYAQAIYLAEHDFNYWFDTEEINILEEHNEEFRSQESEEQLLPILFDLPAEGKGEFMTTAQISERLVSFGGIKKPMGLSKLGVLLGKAGYENIQRRINKVKTRGWLVYQRNSDEIHSIKKILAHD